MDHYLVWNCSTAPDNGMANVSQVVHVAHWFSSFELRPQEVDCKAAKAYTVALDIVSGFAPASLLRAAGASTLQRGLEGVPVKPILGGPPVCPPDSR